MSMIRVDDDVKQRLEALKRDDESFNDLLDRLSRSETDIAEKAGALEGIVDDDFAEKVEQTHEELTESFDERFNG